MQKVMLPVAFIVILGSLIGFATNASVNPLAELGVHKWNNLEFGGGILIGIITGVAMKLVMYLIMRYNNGNATLPFIATYFCVILSFLASQFFAPVLAYCGAAIGVIGIHMIMDLFQESSEAWIIQFFENNEPDGPARIRNHFAQLETNELVGDVLASVNDFDVTGLATALEKFLDTTRHSSWEEFDQKASAAEKEQVAILLSMMSSILQGNFDSPQAVCAMADERTREREERDRVLTADEILQRLQQKEQE